MDTKISDGDLYYILTCIDKGNKGSKELGQFLIKLFGKLMVIIKTLRLTKDLVDEGYATKTGRLLFLTDKGRKFLGRK